MLRLILLGIVLVLAVHAVLRLVAAAFSAMRRPSDGVVGSPKKRSRDIDLSGAKDAHYRDIEE